MITYYKQLNKNNKTVMLLTYDFTPNILDPLVIKITAEEYNSIREEIRKKSLLVNQLYSGEISINDVPTEWQEEIQRRVDERVARMGEYQLDEVTLKAQAYDIITGGTE